VRRSIYFLITFMFIFGWKISAAADLILMISALLVIWVFWTGDVRLTRWDLSIILGLCALCGYAALIVLIFGAVDLQVLLRSIRALINYFGAAALVCLYHFEFRERANQALVVDVYNSIVAHALLICAMFIYEPLRLAVYSFAHTLDYVNRNAPVLLGLRIPGLTYGLASTSVVQAMALALLPPVAMQFLSGRLASTLAWLGAIPLVASLLLTGRTGMVMAVFILPISLFVTLVWRSRELKISPRNWILGFISCVALIVIAITAIQIRVGEANTYVIAHAAEAVDFFAEGGRTTTTERLASSYALPDDIVTIMFGTSNLGRGELAYITSDAGYIKLLFAIGLIGLLLVLLPYFKSLLLCLYCFRVSYLMPLATSAALCLLATIVLNFKELSLLTRNQWSITSILVCVLAMWIRTRSQEKLRSAS